LDSTFPGARAFATTLPQSTSSCLVPVNPSERPIRDIIVNKKKITLKLYDADLEDSDVVGFCDTRGCYPAITLTNFGKDYQFDVGEGYLKHIIKVKAIDPGTASGRDGRVVTLGVQFQNSEVVKIQNQAKKLREMQ
jgi:hypothetical protein